MAGDEGINWVVREPKEEELEELVVMLKRFFDASGYSDITSFDRESLLATLRVIPVLLVVEKNKKLVGTAGAVLYPFYFNTHHLASQEIFWWVDPEHRGIGSKLFDALISEVKAKGAQSLSMIALERLTPEKVGGIYERRGFRPSDRSYIKKL